MGKTVGPIGMAVGVALGSTVGQSFGTMHATSSALAQYRSANMIGDGQQFAKPPGNPLQPVPPHAPQKATQQITAAGAVV